MAAITNEVYIGSKEDPDYYFLNEDIYSVNGNIACNLVAEELSIDTLEFVIDYEYVRRSVFKPKDYDGFMSADNFILCGHYTADIRELPFGTPLWYYNGEKYVGKFYVDSVTRSSKTQYTIKAVSIIGILDKQTFYGGMYSGKTFSSLVRDIFLSNGMQTKQGVEYAQVYGRSYYFSSLTLETVPNCTMELKFHYDELGEGIDSTLTEQTLSITGFVPPESTGLPITVTGKISRESTDVDYDGKIKLYLNYGTQTDIGGIEISPDTDVDIIINCESGKFTVNDETVSFDHEDITFTDIFYSGVMCIVKCTIDSSGWYHYTYAVSGLKAKLFGYTVTKVSGDTERDYVPFRTISDTVNPLLFEKVGNYNASFTTNASGTSPACGPDIFVDYPSFVNYSDEQYEMYQTVEYDEGIADYKIYGWLPVCTKREAIYQMMFAYNINIVKSEDDALLFTWLMDSDPIEIPDSRIYNSGSVTYDSPAKLVEITEHAFVEDSTVDTETLYDNTSGQSANSAFVTFQNAPIISSSITKTGSIVIEAKNENCAVVSGVGTLAGRAYAHTTSVVSKSNTNAEDGQSISVTDAYLVNLDNSENVMKRVFSYYTTRKTIKNSIVLSEESAGRHYSFTDPFKEKENGWLQNMSINASAILKADCEFITNYTPVGNGSNYTKAVVLTGSGEWHVPDSVFKKDVPSIRIVLIGGGHGGQSGLKGEDGANGRSTHSRNSGGNYGENGTGGKIYSYTIENPLKTYEYSCGAGGAGGAICYSTTTHNEGAEGGDTTFGEYSSSEGTTIDSGVHNFFSGAVYGRKPEKSYYMTQAGSNGGYCNGSYSFWWPYPNITYPKVVDGKLVFDTYTYGKGCSDFRTYVQGQNSSYIWYGTVDGGFPGAPALGSNGGDGTASYATGNYLVQGNGGHGGDAVIKPTTPSGGNGGYGGCGGGAGGHTAALDGGTSWPENYGGVVVAGTPGTGGYGGEGGDGAPGCIIVYY